MILRFYPNFRRFTDVWKKPPSYVTALSEQRDRNIQPRLWEVCEHLFFEMKWNKWNWSQRNNNEGWFCGLALFKMRQVFPRREKFSTLSEKYTSIQECSWKNKRVCRHRLETKLINSYKWRRKHIEDQLILWEEYIIILFIDKIEAITANNKNETGPYTMRKKY